MPCADFGWICRSAGHRRAVSGTSSRADLGKYIRENKLDHPIIIGHSLGGFMAFWVGVTVPQQVGPIISVDDLPFLPALFNPDATVESATPYAENFRSLYDAQTTEEFAVNNRKALVSMITDPKDVEPVGALGKKSDPKAVGQAFYELMTTDLQPEVKAIQTPVLLIGATAQTDAQQRAMIESIYQSRSRRFPNTRLCLPPGRGISSNWTNPGFFTRRWNLSSNSRMPPTSGNYLEGRPCDGETGPVR